ncbi:MAG: glycosyltransferase [Bacteroidales bacterium]|nr:glycosyltransferase [Bacteroidales bacterium]
MKIAFFNSTRVWGGGEKWHFEISSALYEKGLETIVFTNIKSELYNRLSPTSQKTIRIKVSNLSFLNPFKIILLSKIFRKEKIDCIILNLSADLKVAGLAARLAGIKRIIYRRGSAIPVRNSFLNRFIFKNVVTDIIANSEETKKTILQNNINLFPAEKIKVIYNGLDTGKYDNAKPGKLFTGKDEELVIGNLGRFVRQKGQRYLVTLAELLKKRNIPAHILLGGEGPLKADIESLAEKADVADMMHFIGFVDDIKRFMSSIDIFVLTSLWEGFGYVIAEAMYFEKPVIAFDVSSNPELIKEDETGFLVKTGDVESIANRIEQLYKERDILVKLGKAGKKSVLEKFTLTKTLDELYALLSQ